jgi:histone demethylase JARID1
MPFLMETETFKFRTRLMRLNSIEAKSRAKLNFLEQLSMFHSQQGNPRLTVPVIDKREVDLWVLRKEVTALGGETAVSYSRAWGTICRKIGLAPAFAQSVRNVYGRIIAPYEDYAFRAKNTLAKMSPRKKKANAAERGGMKRRRRSSSLSTLPNESPVKESPGKIRRRLAEEAARMFVDGDSDLTDTDEETIRMVAEPVAGPSKAAAGSNGANKRRGASALAVSTPASDC